MKHQNEESVGNIIEFSDPPPTPTKTVTLYVACSRNEQTRAGGWGSIILEDDRHFHPFEGGEIDTTSYRLIVIGAVKALQTLQEPTWVRLVTGDDYLFNGMTKWIHGWIENGWGKIQHQDVWKQVAELLGKHTISQERIRVPEKDPLRIQCQQMARNQSGVFSQK